jgi:hypothetical protein
MLGFQKCKRGWVTAVIVFASAALPAGVTLARSPVNSALVTSAAAVGAKPVVVPTNDRLPMVIISSRSTGFDPKEVNSLSRRFLLAIDNQNGPAKVTVRRAVERLSFQGLD